MVHLVDLEDMASGRGAHASNLFCLQLHICMHIYLDECAHVPSPRMHTQARYTCVDMHAQNLFLHALHGSLKNIGFVLTWLGSRGAS